MSFGNIVTGIGTAVQDLFQGEGNAAEAQDYNQASQLAEQNANLTAASTRIQETQEARTVTQALGTQTADVAGAGFTESGSALDLLASSASQGSLAKSLVNIQGAMTENSYAAQAGAYSGEATAAGDAATGSTIGAIAALGGALISGGQQLASAGQTVVKGYDYLFGGGTTTTGSVGASDPLITVGSSGLGTDGVAPTTGSSLIGPSISPEMSATDQAIAGNLPASTDATIDTSGIASGTSESVASQGIATATGDATAADVAGDAAADGAADVAADAAADGAADAAAADVAADAAADGAADAAASDGIFDAIGEGIASVSIICTALNRTGHISKRTWIGDQLYGSQWSSELFEIYLWWGTPIARCIVASKIFAFFAAIVFVPICKEMAFEMGYYSHSSIRGRVFLKLAELFTKAIQWGGADVKARA